MNADAGYVNTGAGARRVNNNVGRKMPAGSLTRPREIFFKKKRRGY